jgi:hypothetical protein
MNKEMPIFLVAGCRKAHSWINEQQGIAIGLDHEKIYGPIENPIFGDVLNLPFRDGSIDKIYADFVLNAIRTTNSSYRDIRDNPCILKDKHFPKSVNDWYKYRMHESAEAVRGNIKEVRWLLRKEALREMMRVTKNNGEIFVVDMSENVGWIETNNVDIFGSVHRNIEIQKLEIIQDDHKRSESLRMLSGNGVRLRKISLKKLY